MIYAEHPPSWQVMAHPMLPESMRYVAAAGAGGPEVLDIGATDVPEPLPDEVLVRVLAAGVNRPDIVQRKGLYPPPPGASPILGLEVAGEVVATGTQVENIEVGDRVCALTNGGGYAEYCAVRRRNACRGPAVTTRFAPRPCPKLSSPSGQTCSCTAGCSPANRC